MTIEPVFVPFRLARRRDGGAREAVALWVGPAGAGDVLKAIAGLPGGRWPSVFEAGPGFLLRLDAPIARPVAGAQRLVEIGKGLFVPIDAELVPALLDDEAAGLGRDRGLVLLPGGRCWAFDPSRPLEPADLLAIPVVAPSGWSPLPEAPRLADRLVELSYEPDAVEAEQRFEAGGEGIGVEDPRAEPEGTGPGASLADRAKRTAGRGIERLGSALGLSGLADLGASWMRKAVDRAATPIEELIGRHEGALRDLLRQFQRGDFEAALRRAPALGDSTPRGTRPASGGGDLGNRPIHYSLRALLGRDDGGTGLYVGDYDLRDELARAYRRAAEDASNRGDFRRAAFIYGKLLGDYRLAADELLRGGLARDAALILLEKAGDQAAAARAFEAAGELDRALALYRKTGQFERAGDLLVRLGDTPAATAAYVQAADRLVADSRRGHLTAGDLMVAKARRPDLAAPYYEVGWADRPSAGAFACAERLCGLRGAAGDAEGLIALVDDAVALAADPLVNEPTIGRFLRTILEQAERPALADRRDDLRDRVLLAAAARLRGRARRGDRSQDWGGALLGGGAHWPTTVLADAEAAYRGALGPSGGRPSSPSRPGIRRVRIDPGMVTAVAFAPAAETVQVGLLDGQVFAYRPDRDELAKRTAYPLPVASLAVDSNGESVVVLWADGARRRLIARFESRGSGIAQMTEGRNLDGRGSCWLTGQVVGGAEPIVGYFDGDRLSLLVGPLLSPRSELPVVEMEVVPAVAMLVPDPSGGSPGLAATISGSGTWCLGDLATGFGPRRSIGWCPAAPGESAIVQPAVSWLQPSAHRLQVAGIDAEGQACLTEIEIRDGRFFPLFTARRSCREGRYRAACLVGPGRLAAVGPAGVDWLRLRGTLLNFRRRDDLDGDDALACFACPRARELVIVRRVAELLALTIASS